MPQVFAICTGACVGALLRWQLGLWLSSPGQLAWGTLAANALGGYGIGLALAWLQATPDLDPLWRLLLITGFFGALTTFSSFSAEVMALMQQQRWGLAAGWAAAHLLTSLALSFAGFHTWSLLSRWIHH